MSDQKKTPDVIGTPEDVRKYIEEQRKRLRLPIDDHRVAPEEHEDGAAEEFVKINIVDFDKQI